MNKKGLVMQDYITALILFSAVAGLLYLSVGSLATDYNTPGIVNEKFSENYDKLSENTDIAEDMLSATSSKSGFNILNAADLLLTSTVSVINLIFSSLDTIKDQVLNIGTDFGIPTPISNIILLTFLSILTVAVIFAIINAINKQDRL